MVNEPDFKRLAAFRLALREFEAFSERAAEAHGLTAQQYQALLAIQGEPEPEPFTVGALAQRLLIKHKSADVLVDRMVQLGLVVRRASQADRRTVEIEVTTKGASACRRVARLNRRELQRIAPALGRHMRQFARAPGD
jgi:DNA-binding MarR family transcriptional regulator